MSTQDDKQDSRSVAGVVIFAVLLAVGTALGIGIYKSRGGAADAVSTAVALPAVTAAAPVEPAPVAVAPVATAVVAAAVETVVAAAAPVADANGSVVVENGVVKFYFASGRSDLPAGAVPALQTAIDAAKSGKRLVLSGFHDATGSRTRNASIAHQRALSVRAALQAAGVAESSIEVKKPEQSVGSGNPAEARRVEVTING